MATTLMRSARAKGWVVLAGLLILGVAILWGLVIFVWSMLAGTGPDSRAAVRPNGIASAPPSPSTSTSATAEIALKAAKNALAARPMLQTAPADALPQPIADSTAGTPVTLPKATDTTGLIPTGFPRTPQGAVAQLAAIDALALRDLNPSNPRQAYDWAVMAGAVPFAQWTPQVGASAGIHRHRAGQDRRRRGGWAPGRCRQDRDSGRQGHRPVQDGQALHPGHHRDHVRLHP